ncbi:MAG: TIGR03435 family protein [Bryobacteraceae bacterium]
MMPVSGLVLCALFGFASQAAPLSFEVASIRPNRGPWHVLHGFSFSGPTLTLEGYTLFDLVTEAYKLKNYQLMLSGPVPRTVAYDTYYNVVAKAEGDRTPTKSEFRQMLQTLLAERCNLEVHREMKEIPVYALVVGKNGPKFKESAAEANWVSNHGVNGRNQTITLVKAAMESLADDIQGSFGVDRPVVDKTGLTGAYTIKLEATPERVSSRGDAEPGELSVFTAVQEQLGLRLESQRAQIEILVVDHIDKPSAN